MAKRLAKLCILIAIFSFIFLITGKATKAGPVCENLFGQCRDECSDPWIDAGKKDCDTDACCIPSCSNRYSYDYPKAQCAEESSCKEKASTNQECDLNGSGEICCLEPNEETECKTKYDGECKNNCNASTEADFGFEFCPGTATCCAEACHSKYEGAECSALEECKEGREAPENRECGLDGSGEICCLERKTGDTECVKEYGGKCNNGPCDQLGEEFVPLNDKHECPGGTETLCCVEKCASKYEGKSCQWEGDCIEGTEAPTNQECADRNLVCCEIQNKCEDLLGFDCVLDSKCNKVYDNGNANLYCNEDAGEVCCEEVKNGGDGDGDGCPSPKEGTGGGFLMFEGSIVPCGRNCDDENTAWDESKSCTLCHFFIMFKQLYDLFFSLLIIVALALLTIGGVVYIVSAGNTNAKTLAKNIISKVLLGFALFLLSWLLVFTVLKFISANTDMLGNGDKWYEFDCDTESVFNKKSSSKK